MEIINENFVTEEDTENVETTPTEEIVGEQETEPAERTYTQSEVDDIVGRRLARNSAKIKKEYDRKYSELEEVLRAGTGKESVEEMTDSFKKFYSSRGIKIPEKPIYSDKDLEVLAKAEAEDVINLGYDEVVDEIERLSKVGFDNMTARDKAYFKVLAEHRIDTERNEELAKIGVTKDTSESKEFRDFASKFNTTTPIREIYEIYSKTKPKKEFKPMGSMKNKTSEEGTVKDFYTRDEALKFTKKDLDKNPALVKAIEASMSKW